MTWRIRRGDRGAGDHGSQRAPARHSLPRWAVLPSAIACTAACTAVALPLAPYFGAVNIVMLYLLATALAALRLGFACSVLIAVLNTLAFDFFFVPPAFSFIVEDTKYLFTLGVMLMVAVVIAGLMARNRRHRDAADARERRTAVLYAMSRDLAVATDAAAMASAASRHIGAVFDGTVAVLIADDHGCLSPLAAPDAGRQDVAAAPADYDLPFAQEVLGRGERGERRTNDVVVSYLPLRGSRRVKGVIVVRPHGPQDRAREEPSLLEAFAAQLALSLQRARVAEAAEAARRSVGHALLRNTLLASISHDLRTPLSAIAGAGSLLAQPEYALNADRRTTLAHLIEVKALDMSRLLTNVLDLVQADSSDTLRTEWHAVEDLVGLALRTNASRVAALRIDLRLPSDLPFVLVEATLFVKIINNLLDNAGKYTPPGTTVTIAASAHPDHLRIVFEDDGPGLPPGDPERLFDKFYRGHSDVDQGVGLGLAICRAAARLHGGDIRAMAGAGGARFEITFPVETQADMPVAAS